MPLSSTGALQLAREQDSFIVTAATPGIKLENVSLELVGQRTLRIRVMQPWTTPPAAKSAAAAVPEGTAALEHVALADETAPIRTNGTAADKAGVPADKGKEEASDDAAGPSAEAQVQDAAGGTSEVPVHDSVPAATPYYESAECEQTCIKREIEKCNIKQPPIGETHDYDSENSWISDGLPSSSRRRRRGGGRWEVGEWREK